MILPAHELADALRPAFDDGIAPGQGANGRRVAGLPEARVAVAQLVGHRQVAEEEAGLIVALQPERVGEVLAREQFGGLHGLPVVEERAGVSIADESARFAEQRPGVSLADGRLLYRGDVEQQVVFRVGEEPEVEDRRDWFIAIEAGAEAAGEGPAAGKSGLGRGGLHVDAFDAQAGGRYFAAEGERAVAEAKRGGRVELQIAPAEHLMGRDLPGLVAVQGDRLFVRIAGQEGEDLRGLVGDGADALAGGGDP